MTEKYTSVKIKAWLLAILIFAAAGLFYFNTYGFDGGYTLCIEKAAAAEADNNYKRAYKYYSKAAKKAPLSSVASVGASNMLVLLDRSGEAVEIMEKFISTGTASEEAYNELINLYEISGTDYTKLISLLDNAAELFNDDSYSDMADRYRTLASSVCAPVLSYASGSYDDPITVEITNENKDLDYYYAIDGDVGINSTLYDGKFKIDNTCLVSLAAFDADGNASTVSYYHYYIGSELDDNTVLMYNNNSVNSGASLAYGNYIYYTADRNLYRRGTTSDKSEKIANACAYSLSMYNGELYFIDADNRYHIYKCGADGNHLTCIAPDSAVSLQVYKGNVYYINKSDNNALYKCTAAGKNTEKLTDDALNSLNVYDDTLYYSTDTGLYSCNLSGDHVRTVISMGTDEAYIYGDKLYYLSHITGTLSSADLSGSNQTVFFDGPIEQAFVCDNGIFYTLSDSDGLYRYDFYSKNTEQVSPDNCGRLSFANGYLTYYDYTQDMLYSVSYDGIAKSVING